MKNKIIALTLFIIPTLTMADTYVHGYERRDGTYVQPYYRTNPNNTRSDNYSTRGNMDPYTGRTGTRDIYPPRDTHQPESQIKETWNYDE